MDTLIIKDLVVECRIGVLEWEQATPQSVWIDLELEIDAAKAAAHDDVNTTIDYARLVAAVTQHAQGKPFHLLETMAEEMALLILKEFHTPQVLVRVKKRALPSIDYAAVEVVRHRNFASRNFSVWGTGRNSTNPAREPQAGP